MLKKTAIILLIGSIHFTLSAGIVPVAITIGTENAGGHGMPSTFFGILVGITKVLHFPIISLALYSRKWFPGNWIYVPVLMNSLLWGTAIFLFALFFRTIKMGKYQLNKRG